MLCKYSGLTVGSIVSDFSFAETLTVHPFLELNFEGFQQEVYKITRKRKLTKRENILVLSYLLKSIGTVVFDVPVEKIYESHHKYLTDRLIKIVETEKSVDLPLLVLSDSPNLFNYVETLEDILNISSIEVSSVTSKYVSKLTTEQKPSLYILGNSSKEKIVEYIGGILRSKQYNKEIEKEIVKIEKIILDKTAAIVSDKILIEAGKTYIINAMQKEKFLEKGELLQYNICLHAIFYLNSALDFIENSNEQDVINKATMIFNGKTICTDF